MNDKGNMSLADS